MSVLKDLTGQRFERWAVIKEADRQRPRKWVCLCDCGTAKEIRQDSLLSGNSKSCGCLANEEASVRWKSKDHSEFSNYSEFKVGQKFERLTVIKDAGKRTENRQKIWECKCDCGNIIEASTGKLKTGDLKSCGCLYQESKENNILNFVKNFVAIDCVENTALTKIDCLAPLKKNNTSGVRGVWWNNSVQKWQADIMFQKQKIYLGVYSKIEDATKARKLAEEKYFEPIIEKYKKEAGA